MSEHNIEIFQLNDCDWFAAASLEACKEIAVEDYGYDDDTFDDPREITEAEMDSLMFIEDIDEDPPGMSKTFRDFTSPFHRRIFAVMLELAEEEKEIDPIIIGEILKNRNQLGSEGGTAVIANLSYGLSVFSKITKYVREVKENSIRREAINRLESLQMQIADESLSVKQLCGSLSGLENSFRNDNPEETDSFRLLKDVFQTDVLLTLGAYFHKEESEFLISTGFPEIDRVLGGGLYQSDMLAAVAPPKSAKSAFAMQLALGMAVRGETVAILSLEMSNLQNELRFIAQKSYADSRERDGTTDHPISASWLRPGLYESTYRQAIDAAESLFDTKLFLCQKPLEWQEVQAETRRLVREKNLRVLIVDYWQLVMNRRRGQTRTESPAEIAKGLKQLGHEPNIVVVPLGQFN